MQTKKEAYELESITCGRRRDSHDFDDFLVTYSVCYGVLKKQGYGSSSASSIIDGVDFHR